MVGAGMTRIFIVAIAIIVAGAAKAGAPEFGMDHFCADFAKNRQGGDLGGMAKTVCLISEESTKALVDKAWIMSRGKTKRPASRPRASRMSVSPLA